MAKKALYFKAEKTLFEGIGVQSYSKVEMESAHEVEGAELEKTVAFIRDKIAKEVNVYPDNVEQITEEEFKKEHEEKEG